MAMSKGRLTPEQIELLHHVELAQAGWRDRLVDQLVVSAALAASAPVSIQAISGSLSAVVELPDFIDIARRSIQRLVSARRVIEVHKGEYAPSESTPLRNGTGSPRGVCRRS